MSPQEALFTALSTRYAATMSSTAKGFFDWDDPQPGTPYRPFVRVEMVDSETDSAGVNGLQFVVRFHAYTDQAQDPSSRNAVVDALRTNFHGYSPGAANGWAVRRLARIRGYSGPQATVEPGHAGGTNHYVEEYVVQVHAA